MDVNVDTATSCCVVSEGGPARAVSGHLETHTRTHLLPLCIVKITGSPPPQRITLNYTGALKTHAHKRGNEKDFRKTEKATKS